MTRRIILLLLVCSVLGADDWELVVSADPSPQYSFFFRLTEEALRAAGDTVTLVPDAEESHHDIRWIYPGTGDDQGWEAVQTGITSGFGGLATIRAPEGDLEAWKRVGSLAEVRQLTREAQLRADSPWVGVWARNSLPYRIDNTLSGGLAPGSYRVVSIAELSLERDRSLLPPPLAPVFFQTGTDWALEVRLNWSREDRARLRAAFQRGWSELRQSGRLGYLLRAYFLPAFQDFGLRERAVIQLP